MVKSTSHHDTMKSKPPFFITIFHHLFPMEITTVIISTSRHWTGLRSSIRSVALFAAEDGLKVSGLTAANPSVKISDNLR